MHPPKKKWGEKLFFPSRFLDVCPMWLTVSYLALQRNEVKKKGPCMDEALILGWPSLGSLWLLLNNNNGADWESDTQLEKNKNKKPFRVYFLMFKPLLLQLLVLHAWFECRGKQHEEQEDYHFIVEKFFGLSSCFFSMKPITNSKKFEPPILFFSFLLFTTEKNLVIPE